MTVDVVELTKRYRGRTVDALDGVTLQVCSGELFVLLGPNGAGKTTLVGILTTRVMATSGQALVDGVDVAAHPAAVKAAIGVVPQHVNLDLSLTARQNLVFHAAYFGIARAQRRARADRLLAEFGLAERGDDRVDRYSRGQVQRLLIARALMHDPRVLFLDEPTTGLDPQARLFVWDRLRSLHERGLSIVLTTHDMVEAATLADRLGVIDHGRLLALDTPAALTASVPGSSIELTLDVDRGDAGGEGVEAAVGVLQALPGIHRVERVDTGGDGREGETVRLYADGDATVLVEPVARVLEARHVSFHDVRLGRRSLEDVFIHLTGRALRG